MRLRRLITLFNRRMADAVGAWRRVRCEQPVRLRTSVRGHGGRQLASGETVLVLSRAGGQWLRRRLVIRGLRDDDGEAPTATVPPAVLEAPQANDAVWRNVTTWIVYAALSVGVFAASGPPA